MRIPTMSESPAAKAKRLNAPVLSPRMLHESKTYQKVVLPPDEFGIASTVVMANKGITYRKSKEVETA